LQCIGAEIVAFEEWLRAHVLTTGLLVIHHVQSEQVRLQHLVASQDR